MNLSKFRVAVLFQILGFCLLALGWIAPRAASAQSQDSILITGVDNLASSGWYFKVKNANSQNLPINNFSIVLSAADGSSLSNSDGPTNAWAGTPSNTNDTLYYTTTGNSILSGTTLSGFDIIAQLNTVDVPYTFTWTTYSNSTLLSTGSFTVVFTSYQDATSLDTASIVTSRVGTDPVFRFNVHNNNDINSSQFQIGAIQLQLLDPTDGTIRPSYVRAPSGWAVDSVTPSTAFLSGVDGNLLDIGHSLDSFVVSLRANPAITQFGWVLKCISTNGYLIDRDTIRNVAASASAATTTSDDSLTASRSLGCVYTLHLENSHATNSKPPSRLTSLVLYGTTAGVTFASVPTFPPNWNKSISSNGDTVTFLAGSDSAGIPSGLTSSTFGISMNNPNGGAFTINWLTRYRYPGQNVQTISSGNLNLSCAIGGNAIDSAAVTAGAAECGYTLAVRNTHNTPQASNLYGISLAITDGSGTFSEAPGSLSSGLTWDVSSPTSSAVRFSVPSASTNFQASGASQNVNFTVIPKKSGSPVNIVWQTFDQNQTAIETPQPFSVTCSPIVKSRCDSVWYTTGDPSTCTQNFGVLNNNTDPVTIIKLTPQTAGWTIDTAMAPLGWTTHVDGGKTFVTYNSSQGIPLLASQDGFMARFSSPTTRDTFAVLVTTTSNNTCDTTVTVMCLANSVAQLGLKASSIKLSAHPNPFQTSTEISVSVPVRMNLNIEVLDILGRTQKILLRGEITEGMHNFHIDSTNLEAGTYYVRVESPIGVVTRKIVLAR